mgnify:CR=1 FL=1
MLEKNFWKLLKKHLPGDASRVENSADEGMPDVSGAYAKNYGVLSTGIDYWIELKVCNNKLKVVDPSKLMRESQKSWHFLRARQGSIIFVMVRYSFWIAVYSATKEHGVYRLLTMVERVGSGYDWPFFEKWLCDKLLEYKISKD